LIINNFGKYSQRQHGKLYSITWKAQEVQAITEDWLEEYNAVRPQDALGWLPPYQAKSANVQKVST